MSKKSKKILAYLMFVAALCGTPAVSEARGGSGGQVKTEKASVAQRGGSLGQSFISYFIDKHGWEALKLLGAGGVSFETAKLLKIGDWDALAKYVLGVKNADLKKAKDLMDQYGVQKEAFDKERKDFSDQRAKALQENEKLVGDKSALELENNNLNAKVKENERKIKELEDSRAKLNSEVLNLKDYNGQLLNLNNEENKKIDTLLSGFLPYKMSGEFAGSYRDDNWVNCNGQINFDPYSNSQGVVTVAFVNYDSDLNMTGNAGELKLGTGSFFDEVEKKAKELLGQDATNVAIALKDVDLGYCGIPRLARYSFVVMREEKPEKVVAAYFPVKSFQLMNNVENNENNENANENIQNNENNNENNDENVQNNGNENGINIDNNNMNNEMNANENNNINGENNENNEGNDN